MTHVKTVVCLANSWKHGGRCVAGLDITEGLGDWVRPISVRPGHAISEAERTLADGSDVAVLDVVRMTLCEYAPTGFQTENWLLDPWSGWERVGRWSYGDAVAAVQQPATLWSNGGSSSVGIHDRVPDRDLPGFDHSIVLIQVEQPTVVVSDNSWSGKTEVRLSFTYRGVRHELKITDPRYHAAYVGQPGRHRLHPRSIVTVSLAEPWEAPGQGAAYSYKVVAAIIEPEDRSEAGHG